MNQSKEFQGRSLDEAIQEACDFYGVPREKLVIDIISDAKSGIFGLVGVKKATIRAGKVGTPGAAPVLPEEGGQSACAKGRQPQSGRGGHAEERTAARHSAKSGSKPDLPPAVLEPGKNTDGSKSIARGAKNGAKNAPRPDSRMQPAEDFAVFADETAPAPSPEGTFSGPDGGGASGDAGLDARPAAPAGNVRPAAPARRGPGSRGRSGPTAAGGREAPFASESEPHPEGVEDREELPDLSLDDCDHTALAAVVRETVLTLVAPIVGPVPCAVEVTGSRVRATLDCGEAAGVLVGRDGLTLSAVQYLAARIVSRKVGGAVRLQIDAGKYRERQDDKLRELALSLAAKARETGRPQSTRPLSAYQRRVVHLALEREAAVTTRSKGEGPQRRVVVYVSRGTAGEQKSENGGNDISRDIPDRFDE